MLELLELNQKLTELLELYDKLKEAGYKRPLHLCYMIPLMSKEEWEKDEIIKDARRDPAFRQFYQLVTNVNKLISSVFGFWIIPFRIREEVVEMLKEKEVTPF